MRDADNDRFRLINHQLARRQVIEEEERFSAVAQHVVDTHSHQVDADPAVLAHLLSDLNTRKSTHYNK